MNIQEVPSYKGSVRSLKPHGGVARPKRKPSALKRKNSAQKPTAVSTRKKKTPEAKLKTELWELCKQIIRKRYGNTCYTCGKGPLSGANWHTGHFIARSVCGANLRYDLRNLRPQDYRCNVNLAGNGAVFYRKMVEIEGQMYVDGIFADKNKITKTNRAWFDQKIEEYTQILAGLENKVMS